MLTGPEKLSWRNALLNAFDTDGFNDLMLSLDDRADRYSGTANSLSKVILATVESYNQRGMVRDLLAAALRVRSQNKDLLSLAMASPSGISHDSRGIEALLVKTNSHLDFSLWLQNAIAIQNAVCRIEVPLSSDGMAFGTGFLLSSDLIMTNWHVVEPLLIEGGQGRPSALPKDVRCRFDYQVLSDGRKSEGTVFSLANNWKVLWSPDGTDGFEPTDVQLDCAILRLSAPAGTLGVSNDCSRDRQRRGWIALPSGAPIAFIERSPLFIVQHPLAKPIKLTLDTSAIIGMNPAGTRVRYSTNTEPGSSGSPCFDQNWNLVALHHRGDPTDTPTWNEGIPMNKIVKLMEANDIVE